jgi:hypothetical protein
MILTSIVGILCSDGIEQPTKKIEIIGGITIVAGTGQIGLGQRFCNFVDKAYREQLFVKNKNPVEIVTQLTKRTLDDFISTHVSAGSYGAMMAFTNGDDFNLCEFDPKTFQPELKRLEKKLLFCSMGSGQAITDPFLGLMKKVFWGDEIPTVAEAKFITAWTLQHAIDLNPGGINGPIQMAAIRKNEKERYSAVMISENEIEEHMNNIHDAEAYLAHYKNILQGKNTGKKIPDLSPSASNT